MKTGRSLQELAAQIEQERGWKKDFVASSTKLEYDPKPGERGAIRFNVNGTDYAPEPTRYALRQLAADTLKIPMPYVDRMLTNGEEGRNLLANNINTWLHKEPRKQMVRTLMNGVQVARAVLSDRYRPLDNADLAEAVIPTLIQAGAQIKSAEITETKFYIHASTPKIELDINQLMKERGIKDKHEGYWDNTKRPNDIVQAGIVISNSEVGAGSIRIEPLIYRLVCYNGLILPTAMRKNHVGRHGNGNLLEDATELYTDKTKELNDQAFWAKVVDIVKGSFNPDKFREYAEALADTGGVELKAGAVETIELVARTYSLNVGEKKSVLDHLIQGGDLSLYGLVNAVTRTAEDVEDYDRAVELERMGGDIIELPPTMWEKVS